MPSCWIASIPVGGISRTSHSVFFLRVNGGWIHFDRMNISNQIRVQMILLVGPPSMQSPWILHDWKKLDWEMVSSKRKQTWSLFCLLLRICVKNKFVCMCALIGTKVHRESLPWHRDLKNGEDCLHLAKNCVPVFASGYRVFSFHWKTIIAI